MGAPGRCDSARACLRSSSLRLYLPYPSTREPAGRDDTSDGITMCSGACTCPFGQSRARGIKVRRGGITRTLWQIP